MRKSNVDVGTVVELKDCSTRLCSDSRKKGSDYGLVHDHIGTVLALPDANGNVKVEFSSHTNPETGYKFMYVHHTNLRRG